MRILLNFYVIMATNTNGNYIEPVFRFVPIMMVILLSLPLTVYAYLGRDTGYLAITHGPTQDHPCFALLGILCVSSLYGKFTGLGLSIIESCRFPFWGHFPFFGGCSPSLGLLVKFITGFTFLCSGAASIFLSNFCGSSLYMPAIFTIAIESIRVNLVFVKVAYWLRVDLLAIWATAILYSINGLGHWSSKIKPLAGLAAGV